MGFHFHFDILLLILLITLIAPFCIAAEQKIVEDETVNAGEIRIFKRLIPADVLRGM